MQLDQLTCSEHGWFAHFGIHESGHATAAILLDIPFVEVAIEPGNQVYGHLALDGRAVGGGVVMPTDQPMEWVGPRPDDALVMVLSGSLAERLLLTHYLQDGWSGDLEIWRKGAGRTAAQSPEESKPIFDKGVEQAEKLVAENRAAILRVYGLMVERVPNDGTHHTGLDEPLVISYEEVRAAVLASP